ncbi:hypothetical protein F2Q70_00027760 [Brassica cretica]|uniref:Uncharacterized protein n=1 Tax=Brassica cretica TaxID=69181 RepID=A0A8S9IFS6_BRACR|nr:hypothetical protein F2Q68_00027316 [Brassica cretica]KAF2602920.1 hypothetical protein F2Q70_00027760 [Brassica cretica]
MVLEDFDMEEDSLPDLELSYLPTELINTSTCPPVIIANDRQLHNFVGFVQKCASTRLQRVAERRREAESSGEAERRGEAARGGKRRRQAERGGEKRRDGEQRRDGERRREAERRRGGERSTEISFAFV